MPLRNSSTTNNNYHRYHLLNPSGNKKQSTVPSANFYNVVFLIQPKFLKKSYDIK